MVSQSLLRINPQVTLLNGLPLLQLPDCLSVPEAIALEATCQDIWQREPVRIVLDLSSTNIIDSSGIGAVINCLKKSREKGVEVVFWSVRSHIIEALLLAGLDPFLIIDSETATITLADSHQTHFFTSHPSVNSRTKRFIDVLGALIGLGITAFLFVAIAIAIKIDSPGPILFSQVRCGLLGKPFRMWKFRSMVANAEELKGQIENKIKGPLFKNNNDPRITQVGHFLRQTSLDELPQFWNVLKGEMSLVGTRPPTFDEVDLYTVAMWKRLNVKPGITGEWQTNGRSHISDFDEVVRLDLRYQQNWSPIYDLKLIIKTLVTVFVKNSGAI